MCPVFYAAKAGLVDTLRLLLDAPGSSDAVSARSPVGGRTALHNAALSCARGDGEEDESVAFSGERTGAPRPSGYAADAHVQLLLAKGADANVTNAAGRVAAFDALEFKRTKVLEALLDATPADAINSRLSDGTTLLIEAASREVALNFVVVLLRRGADARLTRRGPPELQHDPYAGPQSALDAVVHTYMHALSSIYVRARDRVHPVLEILLRKVLIALVSSGAPLNRMNAWVVLPLLPDILRADARAREELARRRSARNRTLGQEDIVLLAMDMLEMRSAEEGVARREARLRGLEGEVGTETGESGESRESGDGEEDEEEEEEEEDSMET
jgi:hypothetical protein